MRDTPYRVLFLCTGNSARSIMAEAILARLGDERYHAESAGSRPTGRVHPLARALLLERGDDISRARSKSWDELAAKRAAPIDFVFSVCDAAAGESCPVWPGAPISAHWGVEDPAACEGTQEEQRRIFERVYERLERRIRAFVGLDHERLDRAGLRARLDEIGRME